MGSGYQHIRKKIISSIIIKIISKKSVREYTQNIA